MHVYMCVWISHKSKRHFIITNRARFDWYDIIRTTHYLFSHQMKYVANQTESVLLTTWSKFDGNFALIKYQIIEFTKAW